MAFLRIARGCPLTASQLTVRRGLPLATRSPAIAARTPEYRLQRSTPLFSNQLRTQATATATASATNEEYLPTTSTASATNEAYWQKIPRWHHVTTEQFTSYQWQLNNTIKEEKGLFGFLSETLPENLAPSKNPLFQHIKTRDDFIKDATAGLEQAPMQVRLTPHICSVIDWHNALDDPIRLQFLPLKSGFMKDHPKVTLDSLNERNDSAVEGLVHRYPDKALFLATSICPVYCRFCTRSYAVGGATDTVTKEPQKPSRKRWELVYEYIEKTPALTDIVVSGGDAYYLQPHIIKEIGERILSIPHIRRIRFASKGLAVAPSRTIDPNDEWTSTFIELSNLGRRLGKHVCLHTHFNHPNEMTWVTRAAARHLFKHGVMVRNQTVLLKGVNDDAETMGTLIRNLADMNIQPYYVYQCDLVKGIEDLRTPLNVILNLEQQLRGTIAGFMMPSFIVDLPGGGGKRLAAAYEKYDELTGVSTFKAPGLSGEKGKKLYAYYDPVSEPAEKPVEIYMSKAPHAEINNGAGQSYMPELQDIPRPSRQYAQSQYTRIQQAPHFEMPRTGCSTRDTTSQESRFSFRSERF